MPCGCCGAHFDVSRVFAFVLKDDVVHINMTLIHFISLFTSPPVVIDVM